MVADDALRIWKPHSGRLADSDDLKLYSDDDMADEMERFIWALWMPSVKIRDVPFPSPGENYGVVDYSSMYMRVRGGKRDSLGKWHDGVDSRFVKLGIETAVQTNLHREKEDPLPPWPGPRNTCAT